MSIRLGTKVKDTITGVVGIATARTTYLHGCARISIAPPMGKDGKAPDWHSCDEHAVEYVSEGVLKNGKPPMVTDVAG